MKNLIYETFEMQNYLLRDDLSIEYKKTFFKWRTRMANFGENYGSGRNGVTCLLCFEHEDSQDKSFTCSILRGKIDIKGQYSDIYDYSNSNLQELIKSLMRISAIREEMETSSTQLRK